MTPACLANATHKLDATTSLKTATDVFSLHLLYALIFLARLVSATLLMDLVPTRMLTALQLTHASLEAVMPPATPAKLLLWTAMTETPAPLILATMDASTLISTVCLTTTSAKTTSATLQLDVVSLMLTAMILIPALRTAAHQLLGA